MRTKGQDIVLGALFAITRSSEIRRLKALVEADTTIPSAAKGKARKLFDEALAIRAHLENTPIVDCDTL